MQNHEMDIETNMSLVTSVFNLSVATDPMASSAVTDECQRVDDLLNAIDEEIVFLMFIFWGIIIPIIALFGLIGNILTMIVLWKKEMRSNTVYFLRVMAITDTGIIVTAILALSLIAITQRDQDLRFFSQVLIPIIYNPVEYLGMTFQMINVWVIVAVATERYVAICHPFSATRLRKKKTAWIILAVITIVSTLYNVPRIFSTKVISCDDMVLDEFQSNAISSSMNISWPNETYTTYNETDISVTFSLIVSIITTTPTLDESTPFNLSSTINTTLPNNNTPSTDPARACFTVIKTEFGKSIFFDKVYLGWMYTILIFTIPLVLLAILNTLLIRELMRMSKKRKGTSIKESSEANMSRVLVIIVLVFILCQTPGLIAQFNFFCPKPMLRYLCVSNTLVVLNSSVNFLIYTTTGRRFRRVLLRILRCMKDNNLVRKMSTFVTQTEFIEEKYDEGDVEFDVEESAQLQNNNELDANLNVRRVS